MYSKGSYNPLPRSAPTRPVLPHPQQNPTASSTLLVQQGHPTAYMCPPPSSRTSSTPQAPLATVPVTAQSHAHLSYMYPTAQHKPQQGVQSVHRSLQQVPVTSTGQTQLLPSTLLPSPPPLSLVSTSQGQASYRQTHPISSFPIPIPPRNLGPPMIPPPPLPPLSSSSLVPDPVVEKGLAAKHVGESIPFHGTVLDHEGKGCSKVGSVVGQDGSSKGSCIHDESWPPVRRGPPGSPVFADSDTEMEDDITRPDNDPAVNYSGGALECGSDQICGALFNKEQLPVEHVSAETNSITSASRDLQTQLPGYNNTSSSYAQSHKEKDDDGSRQASSSPNNGRALNIQESGGGDMYDPFVDSFDPSPNLSNKLTHLEEHGSACDHDIVPRLSVSSNRPPDIKENNRGNDKQAVGDSDIMLRLSVSSNTPRDIIENNRGNDIRPVIPASSVDNEECGENADGDGEWVSEETRSPNSPDGAVESNAKAAKAENGRKKSEEKRKDKESRSMRLFKVVLTQFVKDLLKPSWRQGNMSKEAFKTIVKKTVDKVAGSMEGRRIPKSRAKIDRYIDSSQHKLTKLVMGYVDKYVKA